MGQAGHQFSLWADDELSIQKTDGPRSLASHGPPGYGFHSRTRAFDAMAAFPKHAPSNGYRVLVGRRSLFGFHARIYELHGFAVATSTMLSACPKPMELESTRIQSGRSQDRTLDGDPGELHFVLVLRQRHGSGDRLDTGDLCCLLGDGLADD